MFRNIPIFTQEMAKLLLSVREKAHLSQIEVAKRIGLSLKSGYSYISHLEKGRVKNPPIWTILLYLRACGESWSEFFKHLDAIDFRARHEKMILQLPQPLESRKVQRAAMRYETGIEFPAKEKPETDIDFERLKSRIENKVKPFLIKHEIEENQASLCRKFVREYFNFMVTLNKSGMKAVTEQYQRAGLKTHLLYGLKKIINSVIRAEIKRIEAKKPLPSEKQEKMAVGLTRYRIIIERIEAEAHKLLCELSIPTPWFSLYKGFVRECYKAMKKYCAKNQELLNKSLTDIVHKWKKEGLKQDVLLKLQNKVISTYNDLRMKGVVRS